ncbi:MAG: tetratricopeptide repeat protein, partial [Cyclobacteriaceae bacterium]|nr:tetratricopeptide repeat protein [Cyclobacteriaceae bacterium]
MKKHSYPTTSIAILPFKNISPDKNLNYFSLGFTEDLITDLSRYSSLQVISSHSTGTINEATGADEKIIQSLKADYLVRGSFRQKGNDLRINTQLILANNESIIWSHRYEADINSIFDIQDDVTEQLVSALQREIDVNLLATSRNKPATSLAAYEYWLMGMEELKKGNLESDNNARELFQKALNNDPSYARAYAGLSLSYFNEWTCQFWDRWDYSQKGAYEYAKKAIGLDETNYISLTVLGRLYVYKGEWEKAEHFLRKSLKLNPNDTDNLIQIASCFTYLDYLNEAEKLYLKAIKLNPINTDWYYSFGSLLYFELGEYKKSIELGLKTNLDNVMTDMAALISAAYYHVDDHKNMAVYWKKYLDQFQYKILRGNKLSESEAIRWIVNVNPYKGESNLKPFLKHIGQKTNINPYQSTKKEVIKSVESENFLYQKGQLWEMNYEGKIVMFPDVKGFHDIVKLISAPNQEIHCAEIMGIPVQVEDKSLVMDEKAKTSYRKQLNEYQSELEEAQMMNDHVRASHLQEEYDKLVDHFSKALGLGGKTRKLPEPIEKARSAVTWRIRSA